MTRQPTPSVFSADALRLDQPLPTRPTAATLEKQEQPVAATKMGRPRKYQAKPKTTPIYLHPAVKDALRDICYHERKKEHDLFLEGIEQVLKVRAYPPMAEIIAKAEGK